MIAMQELVVPRSIPSILDIIIRWFDGLVCFVSACRSFFHSVRHENMAHVVSIVFDNYLPCRLHANEGH